jgi:hypothetical protein
MDFLQQLKAIADENGGIIETKVAVQHGISHSLLANMCKACEEQLDNTRTQHENAKVEVEKPFPYKDYNGLRKLDKKVAFG